MKFLMICFDNNSFRYAEKTNSPNRRIYKYWMPNLDAFQRGVYISTNTFSTSAFIQFFIKIHMFWAERGVFFQDSIKIRETYILKWLQCKTHSYMYMKPEKVELLQIANVKRVWRGEEGFLLNYKNKKFIPEYYCK